MMRRSRVAVTRMSEQETVFGQASSRAVLMRTITSKASPGRERLMSLSRSVLVKGVEERRMEESQPLGRRQSWRKRRSVAAAVVGDWICFEVMVCWTICWN